MTTGDASVGSAVVVAAPTPGGAIARAVAITITRTETYDQQARRRTADSLAAVPSAVAAPSASFSNLVAQGRCRCPRRRVDCRPMPLQPGASFWPYTRAQRH